MLVKISNTNTDNTNTDNEDEDIYLEDAQDGEAFSQNGAVRLHAVCNKHVVCLHVRICSQIIFHALPQGSNRAEGLTAAKAAQNSP
jgi:hypothetical protein